jgi:hypothetical protein
MSDGGRAIIWTVIALLICTEKSSTAADSSANPYQGIVDRNVFGLKPPPAPPRPEDNKPPPPKITLTGITTILGNKRALMNVAMPAKPPDPARQKSFILAEGQREGDIEVLEIDEGNGTVKVDNFGTVMILDINKDGAKLPVTAAAPAPGIAPPAALGSKLPISNPYAPAGNTNAAGLRTIPTRQLRLPPSGVPPAPMPTLPGGNPNLNPGPANRRGGLGSQ